VAIIKHDFLTEGVQDTIKVDSLQGTGMVGVLSIGVILTLEQLIVSTKAKRRSDAVKYLGPLNEAMSLWGINTPARIAAFLAQVGHESGGLFYNEEIASGAAYEGRKDLGNTVAGDGRRYKGRGLIQVTGRFNYRAATKGMREFLKDLPDFESYPAALGEVPWCVHSAGWFWYSKKLNRFADVNTDESFVKMTRVINGGVNGLDDRRKLWAKAKATLQV
jgi:putative chitinase